MNKSIRGKQNEQGVALILTLGVIALLLILAMSFAFTARTEKAAANVNADMIRARLLCESGLERAMAYLAYEYDGDEAGDEYPATKAASLFAQGSGSWDGHWYMVVTQDDDDDTSQFERAMSCNLGFDYTPTAADDIPAGASWHHVTNSSGDLVGRIGCLVIDESGKIDPGATVNFHESFLDENGNGTHEAGEPYNDWNDDGNYDSTAVDEDASPPLERLWGFGASEINLGNAYPSGVTTGDVNPNDFRVDMHTGMADRWFSWRQMINAIGMTTTQAEALSLVLFPFSHDAGQRWDDTAAANVNRVDLRNVDWDAAAISDITGGGANNIPWLDDMVDSADNPVTDQVAANLIDFCDADSLATNDFGTGNAYCGVEKVPFINELLLEGTITADVDGEGSLDDTYTFELIVKVELANIYDSNLNSGDIQVVFDIADDDGYTTATAKTIDIAATTVNAGTYQIVQYSETYDMDTDSEINNLQVTNIHIVTHNGTVSSPNLHDYAYLPDTGTTTFDLADTSRFAAVEVQDPRHNTVAAAWTLIDWNTTAGSEAAKNTTANADPSAGSDTETVTDPVAGMSTAYIRNDDMLSLWELGCIHRGEAYQTINLTAFNDDTDTNAVNHTNGDAAILNEVAITPQLPAYGHVNANTPVAETWAGLIGQVQIGCIYSDNTGGTTITTGNRDTIATNLATHCQTTASLNRGHIAAVGSLATGAGQTTDAEQEEIIGKMANLLTTRQNFFRVLVTGQVVKDLGTVNPGGYNVVSYDGGTNYCRILAEQKIMALVYRDAYENTYKIIRLEYMEE